ncbi:hypothetical protein [Actinokineospora cianjurensis]|uniref:Uncharacterized protein n=1 Tax=Actinokineospora cianjurensis TaxID=585224 RepID=A0A421AXL1_9PSEU|nr:hypothetical protein [Actinokineospora cianjurensis]RLK54529.1 hypothetical protein CLV68_5562 [Actinokineospora cianjurensis]
MSEIWRLLRGTDLIGEITITDRDFPWLYGDFTAHPGFAEFQPLFAEELELLNADDDHEAWESVYEKVTGSLALVSPDGPVTHFLLHIDGAEAWFRYLA